MFFFSRRFDMFLTPQKILSTQILTSHVSYEKCSGPKVIKNKKDAYWFNRCGSHNNQEAISLTKSHNRTERESPSQAFGIS